MKQEFVQKMIEKMVSVKFDIVEAEKLIYEFVGNVNQNTPDTIEEEVEKIMKIQQQIEKADTSLKNFFSKYDIIPMETFHKQTMKIAGISVSYDDDVITLTLPQLLPKTKKKRYSYSNDFFDSVNYALREFGEMNDIRYDKAAIVFCHRYTDSIPYTIRDNDNIEISIIINLFVENCFIEDDNGLALHIHNIAEKADKTQTVVYLMSQEKFLKWFPQKQENLKKYRKKAVEK